MEACNGPSSAGSGAIKSDFRRALSPPALRAALGQQTAKSQSGGAEFGAGHGIAQPGDISFRSSRTRPDDRCSDSSIGRNRGLAVDIDYVEALAIFAGFPKVQLVPPGVWPGVKCAVSASVPTRTTSPSCKSLTLATGAMAASAPYWGSSGGSPARSEHTRAPGAGQHPGARQTLKLGQAAGMIVMGVAVQDHFHV